MEYYKLLQLDREPFSNSPDPEYFFNSRQHLGCLQKLELALRLKRGLNVVIGDVGTGKTTLCRQLIRRFADEPEAQTHLILDPTFDTPLEFLKTIVEMLCTDPPQKEMPQTAMKEMIKRALFQSGVDENKTIVLIIDEGQKISDPCLEILRELLNYETNTFKLLQIVIFAQLEFNAALEKHANFTDRINLLHQLKPLRFSDTKQLIQHRLKLSSAAAKPAALFTLPALWAIYRASRGYPRKIIHLCHQSILALIIQNQKKAGWRLIQSCKNRLSVTVSRKRNIIWLTSTALLVALLTIVLFPIFYFDDTTKTTPDAYKINTAEINPSVADAIPTKDNSPVVAANNNNDDTALAVIAPESQDVPTVGPSEKQPYEDSDTGIPKDAMSAPLPMQYTTPPELLGQLPVKPGDTLIALVRKVYGSFHRHYLQSVVANNNHIQNPDNIEIGNIILFPSVAQDPVFPIASFFMVVLEEHDTLPSAIERLEKIEFILGSKPKMVAIWSPANGLLFQIIHGEYFRSQQAAHDHINMLPFAIATQSKIMPGWSEDTIFFSNPFEDVTAFSHKGEG